MGYGSLGGETANDSERGLDFGVDTLILCGEGEGERGWGRQISQQRSISDCESATPIGKTGWEKRGASLYTTGSRN